MSEWEGKSDFEINKAVANLAPFTYIAGDGAYPSQSEDAVHVERKDFKYGNLYECGVDYCNNPQDAWPIILGNEISLLKTDDAKWTATLWSNDDIESWNESPLRAAMIVYLEMNGVKPNE